jgi:hypothetical protein
MCRQPELGTELGCAQFGDVALLLALFLAALLVVLFLIILLAVFLLVFGHRRDLRKGQVLDSGQGSTSGDEPLAQYPWNRCHLRRQRD